MVLKPPKNVQLARFNTFRKDRIHSSGGGIVILIRKNLAFTEIIDLNIPDNRIEICGINLNNVCPPLKIIACYKTPGFILSQDQWEQIINNVADDRNSIIMGDFNSHYSFWNYSSTDSNGENCY